MLDSINQHRKQQKPAAQQQQQNFIYILRKQKYFQKIFQIMAGFRKRGSRTRTWFLLKDSVIFVIILSVLQILIQSAYCHKLNAAVAAAAASAAGPANMPEVATSETEQQQIDNILLEELEQQRQLLPNNFKIKEFTTNLTKEFLLNINNLNLEERIIFKTTATREEQLSESVNNMGNDNKFQGKQNNANKQQGMLQQHKQNETKDDKNSLEDKSSSSNTIMLKTNNTKTTTNTTTIASTVNLSTTANSNSITTTTMAVSNSTTTTTEISKQKLDENTIAPGSDAAVKTGVSTTTPLSTTTTTTSSNRAAAHSNLYRIRENVMLPSEDPEREAQLLYEKSLKEYHGTLLDNETSEDTNSNSSSSSSSSSFSSQSSGASVRNNNDDNSQRTLHAVCDIWSQKHCQCTGTLGRLSLRCRNIGILAVPMDLPSDTIILDLGNNNITKLEANSFFMANHLEELTLADNSLNFVDPLAFYGLSKLKRLSLQNCGLKTLTQNGFEGLVNLISLQLNGNALASMDSNSLHHLPKLRTLRLEGNLFYRIPTNALAGLKSLEALNLGSNLLTIINDEDFPQMPNLVILLLKRNQIMKISSGAFANLTALKVLELDDNLISSIPEGLNRLQHLQEFSATSNRLRWINDTDLPKTLLTLDLRANPIAMINSHAFKGMKKLKKLILSDVRYLKTFPHLDECYSLEILKLDRAGIAEVPDTLCHQTPRLKSLELKTNSIQSIPKLAKCRELRLLDLSSNLIENLKESPFHGLKQLHDLLLSYNRIKQIPQDAFQGINKLQLLDLEGNQIAFIHKDAFVVFNSLEDLNLGNNIFPELPSNGLQRLLHLKTFNNPKLRDFPAPETFPRIQSLILSYAYHCCPFIPLVAMAAKKKPPLVQEAVLFPSDNEFDMSLWNNSMVDIWPQLNNLSKKFGTQMHDIWSNFGQDFTYPGNIPTYMEEYFEEDVPAAGTGTSNGGTNTATGTAASFPGSFGGLFSTVDVEHSPGSIQCLPMPGPFLPCADLFDWWTLRCGVWVVFLLALLGNGTVVFVLIFSRSKMDVPRFLVCNLAAADFFMGIYLGILAIVDASTLGEFRMFAIPWQMSVMCQIAGFLAVLSSELSVFTLAVITLERNYAITHAIHLNKRLSLKQAAYIMSVGWTFALIMAMLPLVGVSDYRKFAVCLPFETTNGVASLTYVIALMFINGCAFLTLMGCYLKMYWAIRGSQAWNTNDSRIAKRMALLVFTDFLCWSPIAFFSITAIFGLQLISLEQAKIFTVFILPLNSCCNPFLYAIMTKQFKKDCVNLCKHFEETRVTRGAGAVTRRGMGAERIPKELPPLLPAVHPPGCRCLRMLPGEMPNWHKIQEKEGTVWSRAWQRIWSCCSCCSACCEHNQPQRLERRRRGRVLRGNKNDPYQYQFSEIKQKNKTRASSISSENFCSSRSSSWRNGNPPVPYMAGHAHGHTCSIPMKMMDPNRRRHSAWLITRKTSQDSNLSSSRNDSSASATTASTSTFRLSRSSAGSTTPLPAITHSNKNPHSHPHPHPHPHSHPHQQFSSTLPKPRLVRQEAVQEEEDSTSPPRLGVRFLPTIPSAADSSVIMEDGDSGPSLTELYASLRQTPQQQQQETTVTTSEPAAKSSIVKTSLKSVTLSSIPSTSSCSPPAIKPSAQDKPP